MCDGGYRQLTGCLCIPRPPLAGCVQEGPEFPPLNSGSATAAGDDVRDACHDVITVVVQLKDIIDAEDDDHMASRRYINVMSMIAELTKAVVTYMEPKDDWPY